MINHEKRLRMGMSLVLVFSFFLVGAASAQYVIDPTNTGSAGCPTTQYGSTVTCSSAMNDPDGRLCGGNTACCIVTDGTSLKPIAGVSATTTSASSTTTPYAGGGFYYNCRGADTTVQFDNWTCFPNSTCYGAPYHVVTQCTAGVAGASTCTQTSAPTVGGTVANKTNCISGWQNCDATLTDCEVNYGVTQAVAWHYKDGVCNGAGAGVKECNSGYLDCNGGVGVNVTDDNCEIHIGGACTTGDGLAGKYANTCNVANPGNAPDCIADAVDFWTGGYSALGGLPTVAAPATYSTINPLIWGKQLDTQGDLLKLSNNDVPSKEFVITNQGCIRFPGSTQEQCAASQGGSIEVASGASGDITTVTQGPGSVVTVVGDLSNVDLTSTLGSFWLTIENSTDNNGTCVISEINGQAITCTATTGFPVAKTSGQEDGNWKVTFVAAGTKGDKGDKGDTGDVGPAGTNFSPNTTEDVIDDCTTYCTTNSLGGAGQDSCSCLVLNPAPSQICVFKDATTPLNSADAVCTNFQGPVGPTGPEGPAGADGTNFSPDVRVSDNTNDECLDSLTAEPSGGCYGLTPSKGGATDAESCSCLVTAPLSGDPAYIVIYTGGVAGAAIPFQGPKGDPGADGTGGIGKFVKKSTATTLGIITSGSLTGYVAANKLCDLTEAGSHVCSQDEILATVAATADLATTFGAEWSGFAWVNSGASKFAQTTVFVDDCKGWTDNTAAHVGSTWEFNTTTGGLGNATPCDSGAQKPLACCK